MTAVGWTLWSASMVVFCLMLRFAVVVVLGG